MLHHRAHRFWFGDAVPEAFVDDHLDFHAAILQTLSEFVSIRDWHAAIQLAVLNQRWRPRVFDITHRRSLRINLWIHSWIVAEIIDRERRDVGVVVIGGPV